MRNSATGAHRDNPLQFLLAARAHSPPLKKRDLHQQHEVEGGRQRVEAGGGEEERVHGSRFSPSSVFKLRREAVGIPSQSFTQPLITPA